MQSAWLFLVEPSLPVGALFKCSSVFGSTFDVCSRGPAGISFQVKMLEGFFAESEKNEKTMEGRIYICSGHL